MSDQASCSRTIPAAPRAIAVQRPCLSLSEDLGRFRSLVRRVAAGLRRRLPADVSREDVESAGWLGLAECHRRYRGTLPIGEFEDLAACRVRGAMLDYLRSDQPRVRAARSAARRLARATQVLESKLQRRIEVDELAELARKVSAMAPTPRHEDVDDLDDLAAPTRAPDDEAHVRKATMALRAAVATLPARLQTVIALRNGEEQSFAEIAARLSISPSRASQLYEEALRRLREAMGVVVPPRSTVH